MLLHPSVNGRTTATQLISNSINRHPLLNVEFLQRIWVPPWSVPFIYLCMKIGMLRLRHHLQIRRPVVPWNLVLVMDDFVLDRLNTMLRNSKKLMDID